MSHKSAVKTMMSEDVQAESILREALNRSPQERQEYVHMVTEGRPLLREKIKSALHSLGSEGFIEPVAKGATFVGDTNGNLQTFNMGEPLKQGAQIGDFEILKILGEGGFAIVYLARQISLDREVALKVSRNEGTEAKILAHLEHDNIVKVYSESLDVDKNYRMICMQYVNGATLSEVIQQLSSMKESNLNGGTILKALDILSKGKSTRDTSPSGERPPIAELGFQESVLWIGSRLANALTYAHERGVLHLDVKPSNIILSRTGRPFLTDFNVSFDHRVIGTGDGLVVGGTPYYMAPEQAMALRSDKPFEALSQVDARVDIYSLGFVLKEFLNLSSAPNTKMNTTHMKHTLMLKDSALTIPRAEPSLRKGIDTGVRLMLNKCTEQDPKKRFSSAAEMSLAIDGCLEIREIIKSARRPGVLIRLGLLAPRMVLTVAWLIPHLLATGMLIRILLSAKREDAAELMESTRNESILILVIAYVIMGVLWMIRNRAIFSYASGRVSRPQDNQIAREKILKMPLWILGVTVLVWGSSHFFVVYLCHSSNYLVAHGKFWARVVLRFAAVLSSTAGYAMILTQLISLKALYPRLWLGCSNIRETAAKELGPLRSRLRLAYLLITLGPLVSTIWAVVHRRAVVRFPWLMDGIVTLVGILFSFFASHRISEIVFAFSGRQSSKKPNENT